MKTSQAEQAYWDALNRLQDGTAKIVNTKSSRFKFTRDAVGREAGKGKGYVRNEPPRVYRRVFYLSRAAMPDRVKLS